MEDMIIDTILDSYTGNEKHVVIPNGVTHISSHAFGNSNIASVEIPNSVRHIGEYAFHSTNLTSVAIPDSVESIGNNAFANTKYLTKVIISKKYKPNFKSTWKYIGFKLGPTYKEEED